jgi:hypothetical protein
MRPNQLLNVDCREGLTRLPAGSVPLTVTSPSYDKLRVFGGHACNFEVFQEVAAELYRVTAPGGYVCWVVADQIKNHQLSCTKLRQALHFRDIGFWLNHEIYLISKGMRRQTNRYSAQVAMAYVFSKGKPRTLHYFNGKRQYLNLLWDRPNTCVGKRNRFSKRNKNGHQESFKTGGLVAAYGPRTNAWEYVVGGSNTHKDKCLVGSPTAQALMAEKQAEDLILAFSRPGELVLDPFSGCATTAKMALLNFRQYLGFEVWDKAHQLALQRLTGAKAKLASHIEAQLAG